ncbi:MAG TPA: zinc ribbon domain-containing protein, partial [Candidatus Aerophobetes bacterium]|nr:zinc ribbon domain-containing protein [Candidatus Aerophobetes bacterium]
MPTYDYECLNCKRRFEIFHKISEKEEKVCPYCGERMRRLIGAGCGLIFKGSGFYI